MKKQANGNNSRAQERVWIDSQGDHKKLELVSSAIVDKLKPMAVRVKTLNFDNGKEFGIQNARKDVSSITQALCISNLNQRCLILVEQFF